MYADIVNRERRAKKPQLLFFNVINVTIVILKYKEVSRAENTTKAGEQMLRLPLQACAPSKSTFLPCQTFPSLQALNS